MTRETMNHLSEEALNDILIGMGCADSKAHLAECPLCRGKAEAFRSDLGAWNTATLNWSEARARRIQVRPAPRRLPLPAFAWALAAAAVVAVAIPVGYETGFLGAHRNAAVVAPAAQEDSEAQIAQDNELLKAVDAAINPREISPLKEYDLSVRPFPHHRRTAQ